MVFPLQSTFLTQDQVALASLSSLLESDLLLSTDECRGKMTCLAHSIMVHWLQV